MSRGGELVQKMHAAERFSEEWTEAIREIIDTVNKQDAALVEIRDKGYDIETEYYNEYLAEIARDAL